MVLQAPICLSIHVRQGVDTPSYSGLSTPHPGPYTAFKQYPRKWGISVAIFLLSRSALWAIKAALASGGDPMANEIQMWPNQPASKRAARPCRHLSPLLREMHSPGLGVEWGEGQDTRRQCHRLSDNCCVQATE